MYGVIFCVIRGLFSLDRDVDFIIVFGEIMGDLGESE